MAKVPIHKLAWNSKQSRKGGRGIFVPRKKNDNRWGPSQGQWDSNKNRSCTLSGLGWYFFLCTFLPCPFSFLLCHLPLFSVSSCCAARGENDEKASWLAGHLGQYAGRIFWPGHRTHLNLYLNWQSLMWILLSTWPHAHSLWSKCFRTQFPCHVQASILTLAFGLYKQRWQWYIVDLHRRAQAYTLSLTHARAHAHARPNGPLVRSIWRMICT